MIKISDIKIDAAYKEDELKAVAAKRLSLPVSEIKTVKILKSSVDARKKPDIFRVLTLDVVLTDEAFSSIRTKIEKGRIKNTSIYDGRKEALFEVPGFFAYKSDIRPIVIGSGPAGLFATLMLARAGMRPILIERGSDCDSRIRKVETFFDTGLLDTRSNVQFGEGGAGTFSDGKLNTGNKDKDGSQKYVLTTFVENGADPCILTDSKPHIGTDVLVNILKSIRKEILSLGGEVRFDSQMTGIKKVKRTDGTEEISGIIINGKDELPAHDVILAIGHSARDTFSYLDSIKVAMEGKDFAVGFRIEHLQEEINKALYGSEYKTRYGNRLENASYKLVSDEINGRRVYSFCMCPGGYVVNSSSEENMLCVNGMSYHNRDGSNANSAIVVSITKNDCLPYGNGPLSGMMFQREIEKKTYSLCGGKIPVQTYGDFKRGIKNSCFGSVKPMIKGAYEPADLRGIYPEYVDECFLRAMEGFERKISGFSSDESLLSGSETRTSSPVRIIRNRETYESINLSGLYPCGEGAGYAGGIMSAACDGLRVAKMIIDKERMKHNER